MSALDAGAVLAVYRKEGAARRSPTRAESTEL